MPSFSLSEAVKKYFRSKNDESLAAARMMFSSQNDNLFQHVDGDRFEAAETYSIISTNGVVPAKKKRSEN